MINYYIIAFIALGLIGLILMRLLAPEKPMWFTLFFIIFVSIFVYNITAEFLPVVLTVAGLIFANHSLQPLFYPVIIKNQVSARYITSHSKRGYPPFKEGSDPKTEVPEFDFYLHNDEVFVIKLPLIPIFRIIKLDFPATTEIYVDNNDLTTYSVVPFIDAPEAKGKSIKLKVRVSAWTITEVLYPVTFTQKLEKEPAVGISGVSYYYPYREEEIDPSLPRGHMSINKKDEYGILIDAFNRESVPIKYYEGVGKISIEDTEVWKKFKNEHTQVSFPNGDNVGLYKGHIYFMISTEIKSMERRYYYISCKGEGKLVKF